MRPKQTSESFWAKVDIRSEDECWPWRGQGTRAGYGTVRWNNKRYTAHRVALYLHDGTPMAGPKDYESSGFAMHSCDNKLCCNPKHLTLGTQSQNNKDAFVRGQNKPRNGSSNANAKLTDDQVREIRTSSESLRKTAKKYGVNYTTVHNIRTRKRYSNVP